MIIFSQNVFGRFVIPSFAPVAVNDTLGEIVENAVTNVQVLDNDQFGGLVSIELFDGVTWGQSADTITGFAQVGAEQSVDISTGAVASNTADSFVYRIIDEIGTSNPATASFTVIPAVSALTYGEKVLALDPVSYYPLAAVTPNVLDQQGVVNGSVAAGTVVVGQPTIVQDNAGGVCLGFSGSQRLSIPHNAAHKSANGGVAVTIQPKSTGAKSIIVASDANNTLGGWSLERQDNGQIRAYMHHNPSIPTSVIELLSAVGASPVREAVHVAFTWGASGLKLYVDGAVVDSEVGITVGAAGTSAITIGMWHSGSTSPYAGLIGNLVIFDGQPSDADVLSIALPLDVTFANPDDIGNVEISSGAHTLDVLANDHYQGTKAAATVTVTVPGNRGTWDVDGSNNLTYTPGAAVGPDTAGRYTVNGSAAAALSATVVDTPPVLGDNDHDALVMAADGQISNAALQAADVYYWSAEIDDAIRDDWNETYEPHRWKFDEDPPTKPTFSTNINSKTYLFARSPVHHAVIMPAVPFADEVLVPGALSNDGVLRHTIRRKTGWDFDNEFRNFRKHDVCLRRRDPHPAYTSINSGPIDRLLYNQTYESGFTFWQGGTQHPNGFAAPGTTCAIMQVHGDYACIYFDVNSSLDFRGFIRSTSSSANDYFDPFPMTKGYSDIHVLKFSFRLNNAGAGHFKVWYNGELKVNVTNKTITSGTSPFQDPCFTYRDPLAMDSSNGRSPSDAGGSDVEPTIYTDRIWRKAV